MFLEISKYLFTLWNSRKSVEPDSVFVTAKHCTEANVQTVQELTFNNH